MKVWAGLAIMALLLLYVWERVDVVQVGYRVEQLKAKKTALERERDELRLKVAMLTAPDRIARAATVKLGMTPPQHGQVRLVRLEPSIPAKGESAGTEIRIAKNDLLRTAP